MKLKINVTVEEEVVEEVDKWAKKFNLNRSQMVQNLLSASLADIKILKALGLFDLAMMVGEIQERFKMSLTKA